jgi:hypothetical protein
MSIGPLGILGSVSAAPAQASGAEAAKGRADAAVQARHAQNAQKTEDAAGIGKTDGEEHSANERDADGRRVWELNAADKRPAAEQPSPAAGPSRDPTGQAGTQLDLSG